MSMDPVSLDAALLRLRFPDLVLRPGMQVVARVASLGAAPRGAIVLAGTLMSASLPAQVRAGDTLRLTVTETSPERVVLRLDAAVPGPAAPAAAPAPIPQTAQVLPLPGAPLLEQRTDPDAEEASGPRRRSGSRPAVRLAYETPALGRLDLRIERGPEGVVVVVGAPAGSVRLAREHAEDLRAALEHRIQAPASVRVDPRREPFDGYA